MSDADVVHDAVERLEWDERREDDNPFKRLRQFTRRSALTGGAAGVAASTLFDPPSTGVTPVKIRRQVRVPDDAAGRARKRSHS